jgi:hypothetical protein
MLNWLIDALIGDGYLIDENGRYRFRYSESRAFWHRRIAR